MRALRKGWMVVIVLVLMFSGLGQCEFLFDENPLIGKQAPEFELQTISRGVMSLSQYRSDQPLILFFWATWCPHCREEMRALSQAKDTLSQKGIKILLINLEESADLVQGFIKKYGLPMEAVMLDTNSQVSDMYGLIGVPTLFFINAKGVVQGMDHAIPENYTQLLGVDKNRR